MVLRGATPIDAVADSKRRHRIQCSIAVWFFLSALFATSPPARAAGNAPLLEAAPTPGASVLIVSFDAMRADALGSYGYTRKTSPRLDRFARRAHVFLEASSTAPVTPTSFAGVFTSRLPHEVFSGWKLEGAPTLAELFRAAGYRTAAFLNNPQLGAKRGFDRGFETYVAYDGGADEPAFEAAIAWLETARGTGHGPVLLWLHLIDPHGPYTRNPEAAHLYATAPGQVPEELNPIRPLHDPAQLARARALYDGEVHKADSLFGRFLDRIDELGLPEESIVTVLSDHGEEFMEHGGVQHGRLTEEHLHIPFMIRTPGQRHGRRIETPVSHLDLLPTLAALTGVAVPQTVSGHDLLAPSVPDRAIVAIGRPGGGVTKASVRSGHDKLILQCFPVYGLRLFDLASDPGERHNRVADAPERARSLQRALWKAIGRAECNQVPVPPKPARAVEIEGLSPERIEALERLGYLRDAGDSPSPAEDDTKAGEATR